MKIEGKKGKVSGVNVNKSIKTRLLLYIALLLHRGSDRKRSLV